MAPLIPDNVDCDKLKVAHPACRSTSSVFTDRDGPDGPTVSPPDVGEAGLAVDNGPDWTDGVTGMAEVDDTHKMSEEVPDTLPHPASPSLNEQGEVTTMAATTVTQGMDEITTNVTIVSDPIDDHNDPENDTDWAMVGSTVCIILVMAVLAGEWIETL